MATGVVLDEHTFQTGNYREMPPENLDRGFVFGGPAAAVSVRSDQNGKIFVDIEGFRP